MKKFLDFATDVLKSVGLAAKKLLKLIASIRKIFKKKPEELTNIKKDFKNSEKGKFNDGT
jgi:hypothetical protein